VSDDLVQFLRARLDEDEQAALAWPEDQRKWETCGARQVTYDSGVGEQVTAIGVGGGGSLGWERITVKRDVDGLAPHIARHDPARILADIEDKRELIKRGDTLFCECDFATSPPTNPDDRSQQIPHHYDCTAYRIAQVLAVAYASHPGYGKEWQPAEG
jgi:hypothetical protein